jgi:hypothetical protein
VKVKVGDKVQRVIPGQVTAVDENSDYVSVRYDTGDTVTLSLHGFDQMFQRAETPVQRETKEK